MSTLPPECEQLLIPGYVLGNLSPAEALLFEEMLRDNPQLSEQVVALQQALDSIYAPPEISPPPALRERILAAAEVQKAETETERISATAEVITPLSPKSLAGILGVVVLAIIALLGIANYRLWRSRTTQVESKLAQNTYLLRGEDLPQTTIAKLVVDGDKLNATLFANNLPVLPPDKVYALWTVVGKKVPYTTDAKGAILTAAFQVGESGDFTQKIAVPQPHLEPRTIQKIAITVEDVSAPQDHKGPIFMSTQ